MLADFPSGSVRRFHAGASVTGAWPASVLHASVFFRDGWTVPPRLMAHCCIVSPDMEEAPEVLCEEQRRLKRVWEEKLHHARELAAHLRKTAKYGHSHEAEFLKADADLEASKKEAAAAFELLSEHKRTHGCL
jgi:hypothetical protein